MTMPSAQDRAFMTRALLSQIKALWPDGSVIISIHRLPEDIVRSGDDPQDMTVDTTGQSFVSSEMHGIKLFT